MGQTIQQRQLKVIEQARIEIAKRNRETLTHFSERPCAAEGLISYRAKGGGWSHGYIMIGAKSDADAMREAFRSSDASHDLEVWNGSEYIPVAAGGATL